MKLFIEGGGDAKRIRTDFQQGFRLLVGKVAAKMPRIVACGSRKNALDKFSRALTQGETAFLLVDSETPVGPQNFGRSWNHLASRKGDEWAKPEGASDDNTHLMVQCMESWFVADPDALEAHFGPGFKRAKLPQNLQVEEVAKADVMSGLDSAVKGIRRDGYDKTRDGFALLGIIDPSRVEERAPHAGRFFEILREKLGAQRNN